MLTMNHFYKLFSATSLHVASLISIFSSLVAHKNRLKLLKSFERFDILWRDILKQRMDHEVFKKRIRKHFILFLMFNAVFFTWNMVFVILDGNYLIYVPQIIILSLIVRHQSFQFYIFMRAIEFRLEILRKSKRLKSEELLKFLVAINEIFRSFNFTFGFSVIGNYLQSYCSILISCFWGANALLGFVPLSYLIGKKFN